MTEPERLERNRAYQKKWRSNPENIAKRKFYMRLHRKKWWIKAVLKARYNA